MSAIGRSNCEQSGKRSFWKKGVTSVPGRYTAGRYYAIGACPSLPASCNVIWKCRRITRMVVIEKCKAGEDNYTELRHTLCPCWRYRRSASNCSIEKVLVVVGLGLRLG